MTFGETIDIDKEIEYSKLRFRTWLNDRVEREFEMMNFKYYLNHHGIIFQSGKPLGKVYVTSCSESDDFKEIWFRHMDETPYKLVQWENKPMNYFTPQYIMGVDPYEKE